MENNTIVEIRRNVYLKLEIYDEKWENNAYGKEQPFYKACIGFPFILKDEHMTPEVLSQCYDEIDAKVKKIYMEVVKNEE